MLLTIQGDGSFTAMEQCSVTDVIGKLQFIVRPSGKILSVNSWQWKLSSLLWRKTGIFRNSLLRIFHHWQDNDINKALFCSNPLSYIILNSTDYKYSIFRNLQISEINNSYCYYTEAVIQRDAKYIISVFHLFH